MKMNKEISKLSAVLALTLLVSMMALVFANGEPTLTATPNNSNIFYVSATGLHVEATVSLNLLNSTDAVVYTFVEQIETNTEGAFTNTLVIVPTSIKGTYTLQANTTITITPEEGEPYTETLTAETEYTVPDLTGANGTQGIQGIQGATGVNGTNGTNGVAGVNGTNGVKGEAGAAGVNGTQGPQGETGPAGPAGATGEIANTGTLVGIAAISIILSLLALAVAAFYKKT